jgi:nucleotide-binding universal stress UspA family protein
MTIIRFNRKGVTMKFVLGYDGSNSAKEALEVIAKYATPLNASVEVICSREGGTSSTEDDEIQKAREHLAFAANSLGEKGLSVKTRLLVRGVTPGEDIVNFAKDTKVDAIFIGIKKRSKVGKLVFGSNAQYVILNAPCPVMTIK